MQDGRLPGEFSRGIGKVTHKLAVLHKMASELINEGQRLEERMLEKIIINRQSLPQCFNETLAQYAKCNQDEETFHRKRELVRRTMRRTGPVIRMFTELVGAYPLDEARNRRKNNMKLYAEGIRRAAVYQVGTIEKAASETPRHCTEPHCEHCLEAASTVKAKLGEAREAVKAADHFLGLRRGELSTEAEEVDRVTNLPSLLKYLALD